VLLLVYQYAFGNSIGVDFGQAAALSLMVAAFLAVFALVFMRATRSWSTT
jgi:multiple sugar transport system permease protein